MITVKKEPLDQDILEMENKTLKHGLSTRQKTLNDMEKKMTLKLSSSLPVKLLVKVEFGFLDDVSSSVYFGASQFKLEKFLGTNQAKLGRIYARRHCFKEQLLHFSVLLSAESSVV